MATSIKIDTITNYNLIASNSMSAATISMFIKTISMSAATISMLNKTISMFAATISMFFKTISMFFKTISMFIKTISMGNPPMQVLLIQFNTLAILENLKTGQNRGFSLNKMKQTGFKTSSATLDKTAATIINNKVAIHKAAAAIF